MTEHTPDTLFQCVGAEVYEDKGMYKDKNGLVFQATHQAGACLLRFNTGSDVGYVNSSPLDLLLQCLEHRLASRNLVEPMFERTNALEHLRRMREWLGRIAEMEQKAQSD